MSDILHVNLSVSVFNRGNTQFYIMLSVSSETDFLSRNLTNLVPGPNVPETISNVLYALLQVGDNEDIYLA